MHSIVFTRRWYALGQRTIKVIVYENVDRRCRQCRTLRIRIVCVNCNRAGTWSGRIQIVFIAMRLRGGLRVVGYQNGRCVGAHWMRLKVYGLLACLRLFLCTGFRFAYIIIGSGAYIRCGHILQSPPNRQRQTTAARWSTLCAIFIFSARDLNRDLRQHIRYIQSGRK